MKEAGTSSIEAAVVVLYMVHRGELTALRSRLECSGMRVVVVAGAKEAACVEALSGVMYFIEVRSGDEVGLEIIERVRCESPTAPVVVLSANREPELRTRARRAGADDYLVTPIRNIDLEMRLARCQQRIFSASPPVDPEVEEREARVLAQRNTRVLRATANKQRPLRNQAETLMAVAQARQASAEGTVVQPPRMSEYDKHSEIDSLTGLLGAGPLLDHLDREYARSTRYGHPLSVLLIDLDHLGAYCTRHGNSAGDQAVRVVSEILRAQLRCPDIVARFDSDCFAVLAPDTTQEDALRLGERLRESLSQENARTVLPGVSVSIGVAGSEGLSIASAAGVLKAAEQALVDAKRSGRNCCRQAPLAR